MACNFSLRYVKLTLQIGVNQRELLRDGEQIQPPQPIYRPRTHVLAPLLLVVSHISPFLLVRSYRSQLHATRCTKQTKGPTDPTAGVRLKPLHRCQRPAHTTSAPAVQSPGSSSSPKDCPKPHHSPRRLPGARQRHRQPRTHARAHEQLQERHNRRAPPTGWLTVFAFLTDRCRLIAVLAFVSPFRS
jgi:hypothetical protein